MNKKKLVYLLNEHKDSEGNFDIFAGLLIITVTYQVLNYVFNKLEIDEKILKEKCK